MAVRELATAAAFAATRPQQKKQPQKASPTDLFLNPFKDIAGWFAKPAAKPKVVSVYSKLNPVDFDRSRTYPGKEPGTAYFRVLMEIPNGKRVWFKVPDTHLMPEVRAEMYKAIASRPAEYENPQTFPERTRYAMEGKVRRNIRTPGTTSSRRSAPPNARSQRAFSNAPTGTQFGRGLVRRQMPR
jgi:hypothetical protein